MSARLNLIPFRCSGCYKHRCFMSLIVLLLASVNGLFAQESNPNLRSAAISVTGTVVEPTDTEAILLEPVYSPSFVMKRYDEEMIRLDPIADEAGSEGGAGLIIAQGIPQRSFRVVVPRVSKMTNTDTNSALEVQLLVSHNSAPEQSSSEYLRETIREFTLNEDGEYFFWIGGSINISDVEDGAYEGQFILELEYL